MRWVVYLLAVVAGAALIATVERAIGYRDAGDWRANIHRALLMALGFALARLP